MTPTQQETFDWIRDWILSHGYSPTIRELQKGLKLSSPAPVQFRLKMLARLEKITIEPGTYRGISIPGLLQPSAIPAIDLEGGDPKDAQILDFVRASIEETGISPSITEISEHIGLSRTASCYRLSQLKERGLLTWQSGGCRTLQIATNEPKAC